MKKTMAKVPPVEWVPCGEALPEPGKFVWVVVGRVIESGSARRYDREVHMGVYRGDKFEIFPYRFPMVSNEVWAWGPITRPEVPVCRANKNGYS